MKLRELSYALLYLDHDPGAGFTCIESELARRVGDGRASTWGREEYLGSKLGCPDRHD